MTYAVGDVFLHNGLRCRVTSLVPGGVEAIRQAFGSQPAARVIVPTADILPLSTKSLTREIYKRCGYPDMLEFLP